MVASYKVWLGEVFSRKKGESTENLLHRNKALNDDQHDDDAGARRQIPWPSSTKTIARLERGRPFPSVDAMGVWKQVIVDKKTNKQDRAMLSYTIRDRLLYFGNLNELYILDYRAPIKEISRRARWISRSSSV